MNIDILNVAVTIVLAILGWLFVNWLTSKREINTKRRELVTTYLIDVYRKLDRFTVCLITGKATEQIATDINSAITDIQLFGSKQQIEYAIKISEVIASAGGVPTEDLKTLTVSLRNDLRKELCLPETDRGIAHLNMQFRDTNNNA